MLIRNFLLTLIFSSILFSKEAESFFKLYISVENVYPEGIHYQVDGKKFENGSSLKRGKHKIKVWKGGFKPYAKEINLEKGLYLKLRLKRDW